MSQFLIDRRTPVRHTNINFLVEAPSGAEAKKLGDELTYAAAWVEGTYPDNVHRTPPVQWAQIEAEFALGRFDV